MTTKRLSKAGFFLTALLSTGPAKTWGAERVMSQTKRGAFSLAPTYSYSSKSILNESGQSIRYNGASYGVDLSVTLFEPVSLFAETRWTTAENSNYSSEELSGQGYSIGLRTAVGEWLEFGLGYGQERDTVNSSSALSETVTSSAVSLTAVAHIWDISESLGIWTSAAYRVGLAAAGENANTDYNSGTTTLDVTIGLRWSPTVTFTYSSGR